MPTEGVGSEIVPDNKEIFHVVLKYSTKEKKEKEKNAGSRFKTETEINSSIICLLHALFRNKAAEMAQYYK